MFPFPLFYRVMPMLIPMALVVSACTGGGAEVGTTSRVTEPPTLTTLSTTTATTTRITTTTSTTLLPPVATASPPGGVEAEIATLIGEAERIRGLGFIIQPRVVLLSKSQFNARVVTAGTAVPSTRNRAHTVLLQLAEVLGEDESLDDWQDDVTRLPEFAWYDGGSTDLFILAQLEGYGPLARSEIVHEIVHALTDQYYGWFDLRADLLESGADDRLLALESLIEGDATYFQLVYTQEMSDEHRREIARAFLEASPPADLVPAWALADFTFSFEEGFEFVLELVANGGIAAVDRAYLDPPTSSEHILHPGRYRRAEAAVPLDAIDASLDGYDTLVAASLGEWGLQQLIAGTILPGLLTQTADGWGGDGYLLLTNPDGGVAFVLVYRGDTEADTEEVTRAFIDLAEDELKLGDGSRFQGGQAYSRNGRPWMFVDREEFGLLVVIASERGTGRDLAGQLSPP